MTNGPRLDQQRHSRRQKRYLLNTDSAGAFSTVRSHMTKKVFLKDKVNVAFGTVEGWVSLAGLPVPLHVGAEIGALRETRVADRAPERFVSCVDGHVRLQTGLILELPAAHCTAHSFLSDVSDSDVLPQGLQGTELRIARLTAVSFTRCVN